MHSVMDVDNPEPDQDAAANTDSKQVSHSVWQYTTIISICCVTLVLGTIAGLIVLALIPIYIPTKQVNAQDKLTNSFRLEYASSLVTGGSLTVANLQTLANDLMRELHIRQLTVNDASFTPASSNTTGKRRREIEINTKQCPKDSNARGDNFIVSISVPYPPGCDFVRCHQDFTASVQQNIEILYYGFNLTITFTNGETFEVQLSLCSSDIIIPGSTATTITSISTSSSIISSTELPTTTEVICVSPNVRTSSGTCIDVSNDFNNCGTIGNKCDGIIYARCSAGACIPPAYQLTNPYVVWSGTVNGTTDDDYYQVFLPLNITLYGTTISNISISTNGVFCLADCSSTIGNTPLPTAAFSGTTVFPLWSDLYINNGTSQGIYYAISGNSPNRTVVFEFYGTPYDQPNQYIRYQIVFFEAAPVVVQLNYLELVDGGILSTVGVQGSSSGPSIMYSYEDSFFIMPNMSIIFDTNLGKFTTVFLSRSITCTMGQAFVQEVCVQRGSLNFVARWSRGDGQGNIIVYTPYNDTIDLANPNGVSPLNKGQFEKISDDNQLDNVYWPLNDPAPIGFYQVCFNTSGLFNGSDTSPVTVTLEILHLGSVPQTMNRTFNKATLNLDHCTNTSDTFLRTYKIEWASVGSMTTARSRHTASVLNDGTVLVAGGYNDSSALKTVELFNSSTENFTSINEMNLARYLHTASVLQDGRVLVAGGYNITSSLAAAELYDPLTKTWTDANSMQIARRSHTASLLLNGSVLVAGGTNGSYQNTAELYDPTAGTWTLVNNMINTRRYHTATVLSNGKVLVVGGYNGNAINAAELYDPSTNSWTSAPNMTTARYLHTASLLSDGNVLVAGGANDSYYLSTAEVYNPSADTWVDVNNMNYFQEAATASVLSDQRVLVLGGYGNRFLNTAEFYDPATTTWTVAESMAYSREFHTASVLSNGKVLVVGGFNGTELNSVEWFYP